MAFPTHARSGQNAGSGEREAALALLRIKADLRQTLLRRPEGPDQTLAWSSGISSLLIEAARGRLYLSRLREALGEPAYPTSLCPTDVPLECLGCVT